MKVVVSFNARGGLTVTPEEQHRKDAGALGENRRKAKDRIKHRLEQPPEADSLGRLKLPSTFRQYLLGK